MTPSSGPPKKGILLLADDKGGPPPLSSPDEPDADDQQGGDQSATCASCYAFRPSDGRCQLNPPDTGGWAQVEPEDYCCHYKKGPQHDSAGAAQQQVTQSMPGHAANGSPLGQRSQTQPQY